MFIQNNKISKEINYEQANKMNDGQIFENFKRCNLMRKAVD